MAVRDAVHFLRFRGELAIRAPQGGEGEPCCPLISRPGLPLTLLQLPCDLLGITLYTTVTHLTSGRRGDSVAVPNYSHAI